MFSCFENYIFDRTRDIEIKNKLTVSRGEEGGRGRKGGKEEKGQSQGTCVKDPWRKTTGERIECGRWEVGRAGENNGGKMGITVIEQ